MEARMADKPILFSAPMVRALLAGTKTQTRRICKAELQAAFDRSGEAILQRWPNQKGTGWEVGDRLWVREIHAFVGSCDPGLLVTRADYPDCVPRHYENVPSESGVRWRPSIHMPRWASRLTLTVTDVRVQRLQDISEEDARAEGIEWRDSMWGTWRGDGSQLCGGSDNARDAYRCLWLNINDPGSWDANPWIAAVTFDVRKGNIDG
jgi:hypothetical protein